MDLLTAINDFILADLTHITGPCGPFFAVLGERKTHSSSCEEGVTTLLLLILLLSYEYYYYYEYEYHCCMYLSTAVSYIYT